MAKETKETKEKASVRKFGKAAFVDSAASSKDRLIHSVVLEDGKTYTKDEASRLVNAWKKKEVKL